MTKSLKKPLSVEKEIEYLRFAMREPCGCKVCEDERANIGENCVIRQALTQAHQAGIDEAVKIMESMKEDGETPFGHQELHETELAYNQALDDTIKALQNKK